MRRLGFNKGYLRSGSLEAKTGADDSLRKSSQGKCAGAGKHTRERRVPSKEVLSDRARVPAAPQGLWSVNCPSGFVPTMTRRLEFYTLATVIA